MNLVGDISHANATTRRTGDSKDGQQTMVEADRSLLTDCLTKYMEGDSLDQNLVASTFAAGSGATAEEICALLHRLWQKGLRPGRKNGPRKWGWFPVVVRQHFESERAHRTAAPKHWSESEGKRTIVSSAFEAKANE
jgi:hypothetical protein